MMKLTGIMNINQFLVIKYIMKGRDKNAVYQREICTGGKER